MAPRSPPTSVRATGRASVARPKPPRAREPEGTASPNATQRIAEAITTAIVERRLMPGTKLAEQRIADIFKVSRTLVRQALMQLSREHLITLAPARGARVAEPSAEEARQVFEVRRLLETAMIRKAAVTLTAGQIATLRTHLQAQREAVARNDVPVRTRLLAEFHVVLARLLGNEVLARMLSDLVSRSSLISLMYQSAHSADQSLAEHEALVDALEQHDVRAAVKRVQQHLHNVERSHLQPAPETDLRMALLPPRSSTHRSPPSP